MGTETEQLFSSVFEQKFDKVTNESMECSQNVPFNIQFVKQSPSCALSLWIELYMEYHNMFVC